MGQYYAINGSFLLEPALGVQRYAAEILKQMNKMAPAYKECLRLVLVLPETPRIEEIRREFSNIEVRCAGKSRRVKVWEQVCFARFLKKEKAKGICLCNTCRCFQRAGWSVSTILSLRHTRNILKSRVHGMKFYTVNGCIHTHFIRQISL